MVHEMEHSLDMPLERVLSLIQHRIMTRTTYFGIPALKNPMDAWVYQEIITETRPGVIIEIGNKAGGGTLALAHLCDLLDHGRVIGIDITHEAVSDVVRNHPRITLIEEDACRCFSRVEKMIQPGETVLIIEDSSHTYDNTFNILRLYSPLIALGGWFIVEDGICRHGLKEGPTPGPYEAAETFVGGNEDFVIDREMESFVLTWNPKGFLRRVTVTEADGTRVGRKSA